MNRDKVTRDTWNKVAELYQDKFMDLDLYNDTYDLICAALPQKNAKILDIGCGPGNITRYLLSKRPDFEILGIDLAKNMIALAEKNNPTATFKVMDSRHISALTSQYDAMVCGFCLPYLSSSDTQQLIHNMGELVRKGGMVYISFVEGAPESSEYQTGSSGDQVFFYYHELEFVTRQLANRGFGEINSCKINYKKNDTETQQHTILTAIKQ